MDFEQIIGILAGILTTIAVIPQIYKAIKSKNVDDISPYMFVTLCLGVGLWTYYGFLKNDLPIIITNGVSFIFNSCMLIIALTAKSEKN
ncbi:MtN3 and saliva related transmembrane protein [Aequorivita viscosa]|uniref:MtN3 and saliva related transmembrane protein n=2 Tax=Aequorivita viscosa TaxID=797419 RepID=A0A1M6NV10_9FLAO|nr:MtN3 and saliva related transmembrane protein [Aequorivita viscosa]SHJ99543.1 MtN3 and saliva related transmembrane protein [Aequorivita viscosa]